MHCPQCGQQQVSEITRFCSRCGFPLEGVMHVLASGGMIPMAQQGAAPPTESSPRRKGVKQGATLLLLGVLMVPALGILYGFTDVNLFAFFTAISAILFFVGGPLRMLYAAIFEEGAHRPAFQQPQQQYRAPVLPPQPLSHVPHVLPPAAANAMGGWRRPNTAELVNRPSVTENTTRLLD